MKIRKIRLFLVIIWLLLAGLIVWFKVLPIGRVAYSKNYLRELNLLGGKGLIGHFTPVDRLVKNSKSQIIGDPVYFSIFTPRTFNEVKLTITYRSNLTTKTPIIETGVLVDKIVWRYKMAPIQNSVIDSLTDWSTLRDGDILVLQRNNTFKDIPTALITLQDSTEVAWYNTSGLLEVQPRKDFLVVHPFKEILIPLQGTHQFYFLGNAKMSKEIALDFTDLNIDKDADDVEISIYEGLTKIYSTKIIDSFGDELSSSARDFKFKFNAPLTSYDNKLYKLEIKTNDDVVIKKIVAAPSALNAVSRLKLATAKDQSLSFWTNSSYLQATAFAPAGRQSINFDGQEFKIDSAYWQFEFGGSGAGVKEIKINKANLILENNNTLAFSSDSLLDINSSQIDRHFVLDDKTQFIVAQYKTPQILEDGWRQATVTIDTKDAYREKGKYSFIISVPGLSLAQVGSLEVSEIKAEFLGRNIFDKIAELIKSYVN